MAPPLKLIGVVSCLFAFIFGLITNLTDDWRRYNSPQTGPGYDDVVRVRGLQTMTTRSYLSGRLKFSLTVDDQPNITACENGLPSNKDNCEQSASGRSNAYGLSIAGMVFLGIGIITGVIGVAGNAAGKIATIIYAVAIGISIALFFGAVGAFASKVGDIDFPLVFSPATTYYGTSYGFEIAAGVAAGIGFILYIIGAFSGGGTK